MSIHLRTCTHTFTKKPTVQQKRMKQNKTNRRPEQKQTEKSTTIKKNWIMFLVRCACACDDFLVLEITSFRLVALGHLSWRYIHFYPGYLRLSFQTAVYGQLLVYFMAIVRQLIHPSYAVVLFLFSCLCLDLVVQFGRRSLGVLKHWTSHYWFHDH